MSRRIFGRSRTQGSPQRHIILVNLPKPATHQTVNLQPLKFSQRLLPPLGDFGALNDPDAEISIGISCMNCQNMIADFLIEKHSLTCTSISDDVLQMDEQSPIELTRFKIFKLSNFLENKDNDIIYKPSERNIIAILIRLCKKLLEHDDLKPTQSLEVTKSIKCLLDGFKGSLSLRIYTERLLTLSNEYHDILASLEKSELESKKLEVEDLISKVQVYKKRAQTIQKSIFKTNPAVKLDLTKLGFTRLEDVNSDISSTRSLKSDLSMTSFIDDEKFNESDISEAEDHSEVRNISKGETKEELQRYFYSQCLAFKLKFNSKDFIKHIPTSRIYQKALDENIPVENWLVFIENELNLPENLVKIMNQPRKSRRSQPKNSNKKLHYFETIVEEDV